MKNITTKKLKFKAAEVSVDEYIAVMPTIVNLEIGIVGPIMLIRSRINNSLKIMYEGSKD